jgi:hypothetical protein
LFQSTCGSKNKVLNGTGRRNRYSRATLLSRPQRPLGVAGRQEAPDAGARLSTYTIDGIIAGLVAIHLFASPLMAEPRSAASRNAAAFPTIRPAALRSRAAPATPSAPAQRRMLRGALLARDLIRLKPNRRDWSSWSVRVTDEDKHSVIELRFSEAF